MGRESESGYGTADKVGCIYIYMYTFGVTWVVRHCVSHDQMLQI